MSNFYRTPEELAELKRKKELAARRQVTPPSKGNMTRPTYTNVPTPNNDWGTKYEPDSNDRGRDSDSGSNDSSDSFSTD